MQKVRGVVHGVIVVSTLLAWPAGGAVLQEDFSGDPLAHGWRRVGDVSLFEFDPTAQAVRVTWDSARSNSFFALPLGTILTRNDDFSLAFDLRMDSIAIGTTPGKSFTFQIALGLINLGQASSTNFLRGSGTQSPNLVEFDYFPDSGFGATISPTIISSNNQFASSFNSPLELTTNDLFQIEMRYTATNGTLLTSIRKNGQPFDAIKPTALGEEFTDFRVDHFAVSSYNDEGQDPQFGGSIRARGTLDNLVLTLPPPAVQNLSGSFTNAQWQLQFVGQAGWVYTLERTEELQGWSTLSSMTNAVEGPVVLIDANPANKGFYRVKAEKP